MSHSDYCQHDFGVSPLMLYYEVTLACDLVCKHCRASAQAEPHADELSTAEAKALLEQVASFPRRPTLVLTGGDPLKRGDLLELIRRDVLSLRLKALERQRPAFIIETSVVTFNNSTGRSQLGGTP